MLLAMGKPHGAIRILDSYLQVYIVSLDVSGTNPASSFQEPLVAAIKVLADAYVRTGIQHNLFEAGRIRAEMEETEAILAGYWEGVLVETPWEPQEQRRAAAAAGAAAAVEAREEASPAMNKSKAA